MKKLVQVLTVLSIGLLAFVGSNRANQASAKGVHHHVQTTLKAYPKNLRKTWYHYVGKFNGKNYYNKYSFNAHQMKETLYFRHNNKISEFHTVNPLKSHPVNYEVPFKEIMHTPKSEMNWDIANNEKMNGRKYINVTGWFAGAGNGNFFNVSNQKVNGKSTKMLADGTGISAWMDAKRSFYFNSKLAARHAVNQHFDHFDYYA
ncbi:hypothetical protein WR164_00150 [Philodulcilactobacillus myokoensis]|uniref:Uncharacterized protein n=1 Tax=Philodulcilactobacillus myokoensis TaxID=2929573 RepID=A0A9W6AZU8_9LACO|nr:hypothetical protein [Philodulcilactobacillus myokoensis]GLB46036.1 hypothetical protein WR164_00150 [Philodulcilactobacillus myokoensis]